MSEPLEGRPYGFWSHYYLDSEAETIRVLKAEQLAKKIVLALKMEADSGLSSSPPTSTLKENHERPIPNSHRLGDSPTTGSIGDEPTTTTTGTVHL
jgi:hypothetical protein